MSKGSTQRPTDAPTYRNNYDSIFGTSRPPENPIVGDEGRTALLKLWEEDSRKNNDKVKEWK